MTISLRRTGGLYEVRVASGRIYDVVGQSYQTYWSGNSTFAHRITTIQ